MSSLSSLPLTVVVDAALEEARRDTGDSPVPYLIELHDRPTAEVLELAVNWSTSDDAEKRDLGISILRGLGPAGDANRRPFSDRVIPHLLTLLEAEVDPLVERSLLQALAFNGATEALDEFLRRVDHPDDGVRVTVAFQLPGLGRPDGPSPAMLDAFEHLTHDADADVRYYALYALTAEEGFPVPRARKLRAARRLIDDPDPQVRELAQEASKTA